MTLIVNTMSHVTHLVNERLLRNFPLNILKIQKKIKKYYTKYILIYSNLVKILKARNEEQMKKIS